MTYVVRRARQELQKIVLLTANNLNKIELGLTDDGQQFNNCWHNETKRFVQYPASVVPQQRNIYLKFVRLILPTI